MDPVSIATATGTAIKLVFDASSTLYTFINETNNVDQTVKDLAAEVSSLKRTLLEVDSVIKQPSLASIEKRIATDDSQALWDTFYGCLEDCQLTVVRLSSALDGVNYKSSNWAKQAFRQVKLNLKKDDINSLRNQIHTHSITLSTALQLVNIRATYLAPGAVIDGLGPRIDTLQKSLDDMAASLRHPENDASPILQVLVQSELSNTQKIHSLGKQVLAKATTVYGSSIGHASIFGDEMDSEAILRTINWIPEATPHDRTYSTSSRIPFDRHQTTSSIVDSGIDTAETESVSFPNETDIVDSDSEAEFELEIAQGLLEAGKEAFEAAAYEKAVGFLQKGIAACNRLPRHLKSQLDVVEIPLMIATCKYHLEEIEEASHHLTILVRQESSSDQDAVRKCQVSHLLSQICLIKNQAEDAELHCRNSLKGRRRLLGKTHQDYFASLSLLSEICLIREKHEEAAVFKNMVPPDSQSSAEMTHLKTLLASRKTAEMSGDIVIQAQHSGDGAPANQSGQWLVTTPVRAKISDNDSPIVSTTRPSDSQPLIHRSQTGSHRIVFDSMPQSLKGHTDTVWGVAFSPDGLLLASASDDKTVRLWDPKTGREVRKLVGHTSYVSNVAFSPDGLLLASASSDKMVRLWDHKTGREVRKLEGHTKWVTGVAFSPDGSLLASASKDKTVRLWDPQTGQQVRKIRGHSSWARRVGFSPDGLLLASSSNDETVRLWDPKTGQEVWRLEGHTSLVCGVTFSPDGSLLASASYDKTARLWDPKTGREVRKLEGHINDVNNVAFSPDGSLLVSASDDKTVRLWSVETGREVQRLEAKSECYTVAISPDGSLLASGADDGIVRLWTALQ